MFAVRRVLHPSDFSELSRPAFDTACALARDCGAELVICHVAPLPAMGDHGPADEGEAALVRLEQEVGIDPRVRVVHEWAYGNPVWQILRMAREGRADLIVMGTHGRGGLSRVLMGSVAEAVMRKAPCPVVTVRGPYPLAEEVPAPAAAATAGGAG